MQIRDKLIPYPLIQGGMGVGISMGNLAGAVAGCGGIGLISTANIGFLEPDFYENSLIANQRALTKQIKLAKEKSGGVGLVGINAMVATVQYEPLVRTAIEAGADCIISGAGLPLRLPEYTDGSNILIAPIVSSAKATATISRFWDKKYKRAADFLVIEGPRAGGHLGFHGDELIEHTTQSLATILQEVKEVIAPYEQSYGRKIPIFVAGGVNTPTEISKMLALGADGVQVATRFIVTEECDASPAYKQCYIKAKNEDALIVKSPVGMPARALQSPFLEKLQKEQRIPPTKCINCIHTCNPAETPYCITNALIKAFEGNWEEGLFFCDDDLSILTTMTTVPELMKELTSPWRNI